MNTLLFTIVGAATLLPGAPPAAPVPAVPAAEQSLTGKVLVLTNERTLEGDIERVGEQYRVRRGGGELWVAGDRVLRLCADLEAAYLVLQARVKGEDADGHLRLAGWCKDHGLRPQAVAEAEAANKAKPNYPPVRAFLMSLQSTSGTAQATPLPLPPAPPPPSFDLTQEAINQFGTRVQPILMNACAGCHNETRGTAFRLTRAYEIGVGNRKTLQENVNAVLAYVNAAQPPTSAFLLKAASVHWPVEKVGAAVPAPFHNRHAPAFRALEDWVRLAVSTSPQLAELPPAPKPDTPAPEAPKPETAPPPRKAESPELLPSPPAVPSPPSNPPASQAAPAPPKAPDAYDPDEFNRRNHPERVPKDETRPRP